MTWKAWEKIMQNKFSLKWVKPPIKIIIVTLLGLFKVLKVILKILIVKLVKKDRIIIIHKYKCRVKIKKWIKIKVIKGKFNTIIVRKEQIFQIFPVWLGVKLRKKNLMTKRTEYLIYRSSSNNKVKIVVV